MRTLWVGLLASVLTSLVVAQTLDPRETVTLGVPLSLGMSEDSAVKKLAESGHKVTKHEPPDALKQKGFTSMWFVDDGSGGVILFSYGRLTSVSKDLLPNEGKLPSSVGSHIFSDAELQTEGDLHCAIETENGVR